jgi:iron(III) transport system substrate-binding protein
MRTILAALAALVVAFAAHAQPVTTAVTGKFTGPNRAARLIAGAKKEGALTLYSSLPVEVMTDVTNAFTGKYDVKVELWRAGSEQILQRALTEARAGRFAADVMETAGPEMEGATRARLLEEIDTPYAAELMPQARVQGRPWIASRLSVFTIAYNTNIVKKNDAPKSYADLLDEKWKGKLGIEADDNNWLMAISDVMSEDRAAALFRGIVAKNGISPRKGHSLMANLVVSGEVPVALTAYADEIDKLKKTGAPIDNVFTEPTIAMPTAVAAFARAPHPHAAVLFVDFLLSEEGQRVLARHSVVPTHRKVQNLPVEVTLMDVPKYLRESAKWTRAYRDIFLSR